MTKARYAAAMEALYLACIVVSAASLVVITLIIPYGVFMRYVVNAPASCPGPNWRLLRTISAFVSSAQPQALAW